MKYPLIFGICLALLASLVSAQEVPFVADVTGVSANDTLNVRENPRSSAGRIGELAPDAKGLEVVGLSDSGDWAQINFGERSGWVARRFLAARETPQPASSLFQAGLVCFGTEPFWTLVSRAPGTEVLFSRMDAPDRSLSPSHIGTSRNSGPYAQVMIAADAEGRMSVTVRHEMCSDGMSDRAFGLGADIIVEGTGEPVLYSGCCSLQVD